MKNQFQFAPLQGSFMLTSMLGIAISILYVIPASKSFGIAFLIIFIAMFISSLISMTHAPISTKGFRK